MNLAVEIIYTFGLSSLLLWPILAAEAQGGFGEYSWKLHPTQTINRVLAPVEPVIMHKYFFKQSFKSEERYDSEKGMFAPGAASYRFQHSTEFFCQDADVLFMPYTSQSSKNKLDFATVHLTKSAFVYVLLVLDNGFNAGETLSVTPSSNVAGWGEIIGALEHESGMDRTYIADATRWADATDRPHLRQYAVAVNVTASLVPTPEVGFMKLILPHPRALQVNGDRVRGMYLVMSPTEYTSQAPVGPHAYPGASGSFRSFLGGPKIFTGEEPPLPNKSCPSWLHDIYVVKKDGWWQTWHPPIDPIWWCYFDHEHGGYPGRYLPRFHYTAYHTYDPNTPDNRQDESHNGFKVMPFIAEDGRAVVMVLHAHMSKARRFFARHHTFMFSVHNVTDPKNWVTELDLYMKADFGPLRAISYGVYLPDQIAIKDYMGDVLDQKAERDTYIWDPDVADNNGFWVSNTPCGGRYEEWRAPINCAYNNGRDYNSGLKFEFHQQQTAMKDPYSTADDNIQRMCGDGMKRSVVFVAGGQPGYTHQTIYFGEEHCNFGPYNGTLASGGSVPRGNNGKFHTDAYFTEIVDPNTYEYGPTYALPQFMKKGFQPVVVGGRRALTNENPWVGIYSYAPNMIRSFSNIERAIDIWEN